MKAADLREKSPEDLQELEKTTRLEVFQNRLKNFTNRLDDTSAIRKAKKTLARIKTVLLERARKNGAPEAAPAAEAAPKPAKKKAAAPKAEAKAAKPKAAQKDQEAAEKPAKKTTAKKASKSEAK
jgi:ribosomal protein L29